MSRLNIAQTNFTAGEVSPKLFGRVDIQRYQNGAKTLENVTPLVYGGARRRYGTRYVAPSKFANSTARLIEFVVNRDLAYMLEFSPLAMRVFKDDGTQVKVSGVPYEIATPYTLAMLPDIDYVQGADYMYLAHQNVPIQRLRRFADALWNLGDAPFTTTPFDEQGIVWNTTLTLSDPTVGVGRTLTSSAAAFMDSDVGRAIVLGPGIAVVTAFVSATVVTVQINAAFTSATLAPLLWTLDASPMTTMTVSGAGPVGQGVAATLGVAGFRGNEGGQFIRVNGGLVKINYIASPTSASGVIIRELSSMTAAPALAWSLESSVWGSIYGYPRTVSLHEQRLIAAGSPKYPQTVWGSRTGEELDFTLGTDDGDAFSFTIASDEVNPIAFVVSTRKLLVLTYGGEFTIEGGVEKPITPTNISIKPQTPHGSRAVRPIQVSKETLFVQRAGRKLRAASYDYAIDGYKSPDLALLAEHITATGIVDMAFQQEADQIVWAVRFDGLLISMTLNRDQDVTGWARHPMKDQDGTINGYVESVAVIPGGDNDQVWLLVRRFVNNTTVRYVERMEPSWLPAPLVYEDDWGYQLDCAVSYDATSTILTGLGHLEGKKVGGLLDGLVMPVQTVVGGSITIPRVAQRALVGLQYDSVVVPLRPEVAGQTGTAQGTRMRTAHVTLRFDRTIGATLDEQVLPFRQFGNDLLDASPGLFSGDVDAGKLGWLRGDSPLLIKQTDPLPFHLLSIIRVFETNAG